MQIRFSFENMGCVFIHADVDCPSNSNWVTERKRRKTEFEPTYTYIMYIYPSFQIHPYLIFTKELRRKSRLTFKGTTLNFNGRPDFESRL